MAVVQFHNGKQKEISAEQGRLIWEVLNKERAAENDAQATYIASIKRIFLNWRNAPDSYISQYIHQIVPVALNEWAVNGQGKPTRPGSDYAWKFAKRWGLWENGQPSSLVTGGQLSVRHSPGW